ncbi:MAG: antitoxin HicB [Parcubacteria group bacterium CG10_big_fil_rev_8_21_14_0_10_41_35]|nr:MAG: antitoxin HicB [Parcubacteria group bacterium CG10_big_fil_rev_8_21_14_0_10_41_35]
MKIFNYNIFLRPEPEGGYTVFVPSLPGCITYGKDIAEAREMAKDAIGAYLHVLKKEGKSIPTDDQSIVASVQIKSYGGRQEQHQRVYA